MSNVSRPQGNVRIAATLALLGAIAMSSTPNDAQTPSPPAPACTGPEHRQFDFWLGEWNVYGPAGKLAGTNSIRREIGGCVLHERYDTGRGYSGESFNIYDEPRKVWHQTWVDSSGLLLQLEGGLKDGKMILEGETRGSDQKITKHRITWSANPDGSVRQLWESSAPNGEWTVAFDGRYTRR